MPNARKPATGLQMTLLAALALAACVVLLVVGRSARREARLVELLEPACNSAGMTHESLRRLVHNEFVPGVSKTEAMQHVTEVCLAGQ